MRAHWLLGTCRHGGPCLASGDGWFLLVGLVPRSALIFVLLAGDCCQMKTPLENKRGWDKPRETAFPGRKGLPVNIFTPTWRGGSTTQGAIESVGVAWPICSTHVAPCCCRAWGLVQPPSMCSGLHCTVDLRSAPTLGPQKVCEKQQQKASPPVHSTPS